MSRKCFIHILIRGVEEANGHFQFNLFKFYTKLNERETNQFIKKKQSSFHKWKLNCSNRSQFLYVLKVRYIRIYEYIFIYLFY